MTFITYTTLDQPLSIDVFNHHLIKLSLPEQEKILRYLRWQDAHASLAGKILLLEAFKQAGFPDISLKEMYRDDYGKPCLANTPAFNISHSGKHVVCAVSNEDVPGVDIEEVRPIGFEDFSSYFTTLEWNAINHSSDPLEAFYQHWCAKEAFIKRDGRGLSNDLRTIEVTNNLVKMDNQISYVRYFDIFPGYKMALATEKDMDVQLIPLRLNSSELH
ncbi:4'-phosphopantetheinyl transferase [Fulvivirga imtechensis AK7]|uniref:4'-phosphopantetheinyl transferase n=1 Tax=Fulvivirga imtechensis AK7 TaxID=1237149 RepID=L8JKN9_9BACT|nr:4'-phosphopantetheinyl transferase superfamily protein [Fulvivirga imtechensis]ELR69496.1 4'-phosphopantetheinyl transferase [Fulvivirga imtechensis AK7]